MSATGDCTATPRPEAFVNTPFDQYVIWDGSNYKGRRGSRMMSILGLVGDPWRPMPLRELAVLAVAAGVADSPEAVRVAVRQHQKALAAAYLFVRRLPNGAFAVVCDVPWPACSSKPLRAEDIVLSADQRRLVEKADAEGDTCHPRRLWGRR